MKKGFVSLRKRTKHYLHIFKGKRSFCIFVGAFTFIGYLIIDLPYAFVLGIIAAFTNIIPNLGPFIGAAPAVIVGLFVSPMQALYVIIIVTIVQQFESNIISPRIMSSKLKYPSVNNYYFNFRGR